MRARREIAQITYSAMENSNVPFSWAGPFPGEWIQVDCSLVEHAPGLSVSTILHHLHLSLL